MTTLSDYRFSDAMLAQKPGPGGMTLVYVDVRNIAHVLDQLAPGWSSDFELQPDGQGNVMAICRLTVGDCTRADTGHGETPMDASNQAFRRAAAAHGLGRYLWVDLPQMITEDQTKELHALGKQKYARTWTKERHRLVEYITKGRSESSKDLTADEADRLICGLKKQLENGEEVAA